MIQNTKLLNIYGIEKCQFQWLKCFNKQSTPNIFIKKMHLGPLGVKTPLSLIVK